MGNQENPVCPKMTTPRGTLPPGSGLGGPMNSLRVFSGSGSLLSTLEVG